MSTRFGYADTPLGQLHYAEHGQGPVVLLLHQCPRSHDEFRELLPLLRGHRAIAMDIPGYGQSAGLPRPQAIEQYAAGALALLDALGIDRAAVLGHHTGGVVGLEMAASAPERVRALVLSSTPWTDATFRARPGGGPGVDDAERDPAGAHLTTWWAQRRPYYPDPATALLDRFVRDALAPGVDPREGHRACARYVIEERVGTVTAPVLLLGADADPFALPDLDPMAAALTASAQVSRVVIPGGTVALMEQEAPEVAAAVLEFLARTG